MMATLTQAQKRVKGKNSLNLATKSAYANTSLNLKGVVNVDNISDERFALLKEILDASVNRQVKWQAKGFISNVIGLLSGKEMTLTYSGTFNGMKIRVESFIKGKVSIKVTKGLTNKVLLETFIPFSPKSMHGTRIGTSRSVVLFNLYKSARYQVDGELLAS